MTSKRVQRVLEFIMVKFEYCICNYATVRLQSGCELFEEDTCPFLTVSVQFNSVEKITIILIFDIYIFDNYSRKTIVFIFQVQNAPTNSGGCLFYQFFWYLSTPYPHIYTAIELDSLIINLDIHVQLRFRKIVTRLCSITRVHEYKIQVNNGTQVVLVRFFLSFFFNLNYCW